jgi:hypothetical protein
MAPFAGYPPEKLEPIESECHVREADSERFTPAEEEAHKARLRETWPTRRASLEASEAAAAPLARPSGLSTSREGPLGTDHRFVSTGNWSGEIAGRWYQVYAGAKVAPSTGGAIRSELLVYAAPANPRSDERPTFLGAFVPPGGGSEPLTIAAVNGDALEIKTSTGAVVSFNVASQSFLSQ